MYIGIICVGIAFVILERVFPDQELPHSHACWLYDLGAGGVSFRAQFNLSITKL